MLRTLVAGASLGSLALAKGQGWTAQAEAPRPTFMAAPLSEGLTDGQGSPMRQRMELFIMRLQGELCRALEEEEEEGEFRVDRWTREEGGGGITCVIQDGAVFEKAGVSRHGLTSSLDPPVPTCPHLVT